VGLSETYRLSDRYTGDTGTVFMTGLQALARLPIEQLRVDRAQGLTTAAFVSGYPGSPLGGYDGAIAAAIREAPELPIVHRPAINEEHAATAVMGSQLASSRPDPRYDGVVGIWYGKAPGVDRASDAIRHGVFAGSDPRGGAVILAGDDPKAKSSTIPSSSAGGLADMLVPVLYPGDPGEALDLGRHAIAMSRATGLWTSLKIVADVADGSGTVHLDADRIRPVIPLLDGEPYLHAADGAVLTPHTVDLEREIHEVRHPLAVEYASQNRLNHATVDPADAWIGVISSGITYREVREALKRLGLGSDPAVADAGIRLLCMHMPLPFNPATVRRFARDLEQIVVIEEKHPNIETLVKESLYNHSHHPLVVGKYDEVGEMLFAGHGSLSADDIIPGLRRRLAPRIGERLAPDEPAAERTHIPLGVSRSPYYCSGCPHNRSTRAPEGSIVGAGIGCHTMAMFMDPDRFGDIAGLTCMGNEGLQWVGMEPFVETRHLIQNLGDGTYFHSGQLAIQGAVAAGVDITYKLLWNGAVAMTGGQDVQGQVALPAVARSLLAQGVARVLVTTDDTRRYRGIDLPPGVDVWPRDRIMDAQEVLSETPGVTVLIHDQGCAAEARRARKRGLLPTPDRRVVINHRLCEGCGNCGEVSNCLSVQPLDTPFGRKTTIDQTTCNFDYSCIEGDCPAFMTVKTSPVWWRRRAGRGPDVETRTEVPAAPDDLPEPVPVVDPDDVSIRITGIGGTGVVTVSQVLGTAAMFDGLEVRGLDQIGLSQKAGPVVSDLHLTRELPADTSRLGRAQADVILAFDQLVAASPTGLDSADPDRTVVVGSTTATPTGAMIAHLDIQLPGVDVQMARIDEVTRPDHRYWADAGAVTTALFGDAVTANVFVVGMAVQAGCLPITPSSIEKAIELNGVAVERNTAAFRWGRTQIARPEIVAERAGHDDPTRGPAPQITSDLAEKVATISRGDEPLESLLTMLTADLVGYQNRRTARSYLGEIARVADRETDVVAGSTLLTTAAARGLHKLMAYKDEYEVARLMFDADGVEPARELARKTGGRISWHLHPPALRFMGRSSKIGFGRWSAPGFRLLARLKWLRGRAIDPFGWTEVRRTERALPGEYLAALASMLEGLEPATLDQAVEVAELPQLIRGYEDIKMRRVAEFRERLGAIQVRDR
jgi:indolepyruvate ferredoxin oxidoreductase